MVYADYNSTTPLNDSSRRRLAEALEIWGNPSSGHQLGRKATEFMEESRRLIASYLDVSPGSIVFTSGGSEANASVLMGSRLRVGSEFRCLVSTVEHSSVLDCVESLEKKWDTTVERLAVDRAGQVDLGEYTRVLRNFKPHLVSIMTANNETGVVFPIPEMVRIAHQEGTLFHTDAVQAFGKMDPSFFRSADFVSLSAHKIGGPKGIGALIVSKNHALEATHFGGAQETKRRGGTQNTIGIAGFAGAVTELSLDSDYSKIAACRDEFEARLLAEIPGVTFQGMTALRVSNTSNVHIPGIGAQVILSALDLEGICVSAGSACSSGSINPSHVLLGMGFGASAAKECVRFSFGKDTSREDIQYIAEAVIRHVKRIYLRKAGLS